MPYPSTSPRTTTAEDPALPKSLTLHAALELVSEQRWKGRRCYPTTVSQGRTAVYDLGTIAKPVLKSAPMEVVTRSVTLGDIAKDHVELAIKGWKAEELAATTINTRVSVLSALGFQTTGLRARVPRVNKWWLNPEAQEKLLSTLRRTGHKFDALMADYIVWSVNTGLRVEESLRLERRHFALVDGRVLVTVPGLKTSMAEATLPLNAAAAEVYFRRFAEDCGPNQLLFPVTYQHLGRLWRECRVVIGARGNKMATLKALRRSAARNLTTNGMPTAMLQHYLRHENIRTTEGYLRLTGGYHAAEFARWV